MAVRLKNKSSFLKEQGNTKWWEWTIFINSDSIKEFDDIEYVEYFIRDSFDNSIVKIKQKKGGFQYTSQGWKESEIQAKLYFRNGATKILKHKLTFNENESNTIRRTEDELNILINTKPRFADILHSSPFDSIRNINGTLTEKVFFDYLFVQDNNQNDLVNQILEVIDSPVQNFQILFLTGFAGTGKTTTIKYLINKIENDKHIYIDLARLAFKNDFEINPLQEAVTNYIHKNIRNNLSSNEKSWFWELIKDKLVPLSKYFTKSFIRIIRGSENELSFQEQLLESNDFGDVFTLFVLYIYFNNKEIDNKIYVYFDNLDVVNSQHFSNKFFEKFSRTIYNLASLSQDVEIFSRYIDFRNNFKFVFCLREENFYIINPHIRDSLKPIYKTLKLKPSKSKYYYRDVIRKRVDFYKYINKNQISDFEDNLHFLNYSLENKDFVDFQQLYNYDLRKVADLIMEFFISSKTLNFNSKTDSFLIKSKLLNTIAYSINNSEVIEYLAKQNPEDHNKLIILMSLLSNLSSNLSKLSAPSSISLKEVRENLQGFINESQLERYLEVLSSVNNWSYLINIEKPDNQSINLNKVRIDVNPSIYYFLKRVYPSFEFFSKLSNLELLDITDLLTVESFDKQKLVTHLQKVLAFVEKIILGKVDIFTNELSTKFSFNEYTRSNFEFKKLESQGGTLSGTIVSRHIYFIDKLRVLFLEKNFNYETKLSVNKIFIDTIYKYCQIVIKSQEMFNEHEKHFSEKMLNKISQIDFNKITATNILYK